MNFRLFLAILLIAMTLMSCEKEKVAPSTSPAATATETRNLDLQPVCISTDKIGGRIGYGTLITDPIKGEYLITARHVFEQYRQYYISYHTDGTSTTYRPILRTDEKSTEVCVAKIGTANTDGPAFSAVRSETSDEVEKRILGRIQINLIVKPPGGMFISTLEKTPVPSLVEWPGLPDQVQALDCYLKPGSSGTGFIRNGNSQTFWVIFGEWPESLLPQMRNWSQNPNPQGFTTICGLTWTQIEEARRSLFGK